jgi:protein-S-isoprenylcysteine O-methyltransferase Ste14
MEKERSDVMKNKTILPPTYLFAAIVLMVVLHFLFPGAKIIAFPWNLLGIIPAALGIGMNLITDKAFKKVGTTVKPYKESTTLITNGMFRVSRHPMYLGFVLILIGIAVFMGSVTPYAVIIVLAILLDVIFIRAEERLLEGTFGEAWVEYKQRVRRWV